MVNQGDIMKAHSVIAILVKTMFEVDSPDDFDVIGKQFSASFGDFSKITYPVNENFKGLSNERLSEIAKSILSGLDCAFLTGVDIGRVCPDLEGLSGGKLQEAQKLFKSEDDLEGFDFSKISKTLQ